MGFIYTKKKDEDKQREKTIPSEEFVNLMIRTKKSPRQKASNNEQTTIN